MPGSRPLALVLVALTALALTATAAAHPALDRQLAQKLAHALAVPHLSRATSAALAVDLESGEVVFGRNATLALAPASNEKLAVTYAALLGLGPEFRIETDVLGTGEQDGAIWRGDLVLKGYGDPTLSTRHLRRLAAQVRAAGIRLVTGSVLGDESFFDQQRRAPGWKISFSIDESPPLSALTVNRGRYRGVVSLDPARSAALAFRDALRAAGVAVSGPAQAGVADAEAVQVGSVVSEPLRTLVRFMDRTSDNLTAELLLKQLGARQGGSGSSASGALVARQLLATAGVPLAGVRLVDGSGLSRLDRLTAAALVGILQAVWADTGLRKPFLAALPVAGVNGTLEDRMRRGPARGRVIAKTGTTDIASALSGFVNGRYAFAVIQNGRPIAWWWAQRAQDRFATVLAAQ